MVTLDACDYAGHGTGFSNKSPAYVQAFLDSDSYALRLIDAVKARANYADEDWLIIICTDHGGDEGGGHGSPLPAHRQVFIASDKPIV